MRSTPITSISSRNERVDRRPRCRRRSGRRSSTAAAGSPGARCRGSARRSRRGRAGTRSCRRRARSRASANAGSARRRRRGSATGCPSCVSAGIATSHGIIHFFMRPSVIMSQGWTSTAMSSLAQWVRKATRCSSSRSRLSEVVADLHADVAVRPGAAGLAAGEVEVLQRHLRQRLQPLRIVRAVLQRKVVHAARPGGGARGIVGIAEEDRRGADDLHVHRLRVHLLDARRRIPERLVDRPERLVGHHDLAAPAILLHRQPRARAPRPAPPPRRASPAERSAHACRSSCRFLLTCEQPCRDGPSRSCGAACACRRCRRTPRTAAAGRSRCSAVAPRPGRPGCRSRPAGRSTIRSRRPRPPGAAAR